jgi:calcineurin-like phosphoesterase family protein
MIYFTSDTHFGHINIIKYCNRPFEGIWTMDEQMIRRWNSIVKYDDEVYHLGDFGFYPTSELIKIRKQLNGAIHLIEGNHDRKALKDPVFRACFESVQPYLEIKVEDEEMDNEQPIVLCHYAFQVWNRSHHGSWHLHGHSHGTLPSADNQARLDVGVDSHDFTPWSYEEVKYAMTKKVFKPVDRNR